MMLPKKLTKREEQRIVFVPEDSVDIYEWQEETLRVDRVTDIKKFHRRKKRFLESAKGKAFLKYRIKKVRRVYGIDIWLVDGRRLRDGRYAGDVDFTMGGHAYRYLYVPTHEIWIDKLYYKTKDYEPIIWHEYIERTLMRNGLPYSYSHSIASHLEIVLREKKFFVLPVSAHRQHHPWTCGPAAMKIVTDYLRYPVSESYLAKISKTSKKTGTDPENIVKAARRLGFSANDQRFLTPRKVKKLISQGIPIIANYQYEPEFGEGHYAVIIGYSDDSYILSDPASNNGYEVVKIKDFHNQWHELEDETIGQGIIINNEDY